jgi:hypothetical protein
VPLARARTVRQKPIGLFPVMPNSLLAAMFRELLVRDVAKTDYTIVFPTRRRRFFSVLQTKACSVLLMSALKRSARFFKILV